VIVVDDGSTDGTAGVAADFGEQIRYFYLPHAGPAAARNLGVRKANGSSLPSSTRMTCGRKTSCAAHELLYGFPRTGHSPGLIHRIKLLGQVQGRIIGAEIDFLFIYTNLGAMVMRRSVFDRIGLLGEDILFNEDTDFWLRAREADLRILVLRRLSLIYRIHGRNLTTGGDLKSMGSLTSYSARSSADAGLLDTSGRYRHCHSYPTCKPNPADLQKYRTGHRSASFCRLGQTGKISVKLSKTSAGRTTHRLNYW